MDSEDKGQQYDLGDPATWRTMPRADFDRLLSEGVDVPGPRGGFYRFKTSTNPFAEARKRHLATSKKKG